MMEKKVKEDERFSSALNTNLQWLGLRWMSSHGFISSSLNEISFSDEDVKTVRTDQN